MKICYVPRQFGAGSRRIIEQANDIVDEYAGQGFSLSLRQLYYQFVARGIFPNKDTEYKRLGSIVNDGRLAGLIDWDAIEDRGRNLAGRYGDDYPPEAYVRAVADTYQLDRWAGQDYRPEVWVEKDALSGIVGRVCDEMDIPYIACKGYMSQSEMWRAGRRLRNYRRGGQIPIVIHLGDHDPSGIDMTRDIEDRLGLFAETYVEVRRIALNMDQVTQYNPPPNPAKLTDSRVGSYLANFGDESWELDALDPAVLAALIRTEIEGLRDDDALAAVKAREQSAVRAIRAISDNWADTVQLVRDAGLLEEENDEDS